jgi:hypothetical protein
MTYHIGQTLPPRARAPALTPLPRHDTMREIIRGKVDAGEP